MDEAEAFSQETGEWACPKGWNVRLDHGAQRWAGRREHTCGSHRTEDQKDRQGPDYPVCSSKDLALYSEGNGKAGKDYKQRLDRICDLERSRYGKHSL